MVTIIDPHIKKDDDFHVYKDAKDMGYFVKVSLPLTYMHRFDILLDSP